MFTKEFVLWTGGGGHRRRVLVLALPDLVADTEGRASGSCTPPSSAHSPAEAKGSRVSFSHAVGNATGGGTRIHPRPAWSRPRALSCDVTLEVELGQELRRIGDTFHRAHAMVGNCTVNHVNVVKKWVFRLTAGVYHSIWLQSVTLMLKWGNRLDLCNCVQLNGKTTLILFKLRKGGHNFEDNIRVTCWPKPVFYNIYRIFQLLKVLLIRKKWKTIIILCRRYCVHLTRIY